VEAEFRGIQRHYRDRLWNGSNPAIIPLPVPELTRFLLGFVGELTDNEGRELWVEAGSMSDENEPRIERVMRRGRIEDDPHDRESLRYWLSRPMAERIAEIERLRQIMHGKDYATTLRLSRSDLRIERRRG
jgi:hypothetical protein